MCNSDIVDNLVKLNKCVCSAVMNNSMKLLRHFLKVQSVRIGQPLLLLAKLAKLAQIAVLLACCWDVFNLHTGPLAFLRSL